MNAFGNNFTYTGMTGNKIILFYKYIGIQDPTALMDRERAVCEVLNLKGRTIIANEGINATLEGTNENVDRYIEYIKKDARFKDLNIKVSEGTIARDAFPRLSIKVKKEIVSTGLPAYIVPGHTDKNNKDAKHIVSRAPYIQPHELKKMYVNKDNFIVIDMRNDYELASGYFDRTVDLGLGNSRDLIKAVEKMKGDNNTFLVNGKEYQIHKDTEIVTACTGGVRCEKMAAYLIDQGYTNVRQLHSGMHGYMEKYPSEDFLGTLYTFDNRKVMHWSPPTKLGDGLEERAIIGKCKFCFVSSERYENCDDKLCHKHYIICDECVEHRGLNCGDCMVNVLE